MKKIFIVILSFIVIVLFIALLVNFIDFFNYKCPFEQLFNVYCAGCGMTRMFKSIYRLDFYQAFRYNSLMFIYFIFFIVYAIINGVRYIDGKRIIKINFKIILIFVCLSLIFMIIRNIPMFSYFKPTIIR